jgi:CshA-type fibril repeat protein
VTSVTRNLMRPRRLVGAGLVLAVVAAAVGVAAVAQAAPLAPAFPTVYISQLIPATDPEYTGATTTTLRSALQSRLANAGAGGVEVHSVGAAASVEHNALGYRDADKHLYAIVRAGAQKYSLLQIGSGGSETVLGPITGLPASGDYVSGAYGGGADADTFFVRDIGGTAPIYAIDVATRTVTRPAVAVSQSATVYDFTWAYGHLWGVELSGANRTLVRIDPTTGVVTRLNVTSLFAAADSTGYGAAWVYGNGNLAFSNNGSGSITQLTVTDPGGATPTVTRVSSIAGPSTSANDGATSPSSPADLQLTVTQPAPAAPSSPIAWSVQVTNHGAGASSGGTFSFAVPTGVTGLGLPTGCTVAGGVVQCVSGQLVDGGSDSYDFTATSPAAATVSSSSLITVIGNEADTADNTATLVVSPLPQALTSSGVGTAVQTVPSGAPAGGSVTLLDGSSPVTTLTVTGAGTYSVSGTSLRFTPVNGYTGTATAASFRISSAGGETGTGSYTPTVTTPAGPTAGAHTSSGVGTAQQQSTVSPRPAGGALTLLDGSSPVTALTVTGQGTYSLDAATAVVTFTPVLGYRGTATPVPYRVTDAYGQSATGSYTPTVTSPAPPVATPYTSTGTGTAPQSPAMAVPVPPGGSVSLRSGSSDTPSISLTAEGAYTLSAAGVFRFTPVLGFAGPATAVTYRVTDAYGQTDTSSYTPTVTAPAGPSATARTSSGVGTAEQAVTVPAPTGGTVTLLDGGTPVTTVTVPGAGTYLLDPGTGDLTFTPVFGFAGPAAAVSYRITDAYGQPSTSTYTATVVAPAGPVAPDRTSTGVGTAPQHTTVAAPPGGTVTLLDAGTPVTTLTVPGAGTYLLDPATGDLTVTPVFGFAGEVAPVTYRITDAYGTSDAGSYTPTVLAPTGPTATPMATTGVGTAPHSVVLPVPQGGSVTLLQAGTPTTVVTEGGEGTYRLTAATGGLTFAPDLGFAGRAHGVTYRVTDAYGQSATAVHVPTVVAPAAPRSTALHSAGTAGTPQTPATALAVPAGGSVTLLDATGAAVDVVEVPGQGSYRLDRATGVLTFTPVAGFTGEARPVTYRITDAYGQTAEASYVATVGAVAAAPTPADAGLAATGADVRTLTGWALGLLAVGVLAVVLGRRHGTRSARG